MAYKFQLGSARLSGSTTFEQALVVESTISASSTLSVASLSLGSVAVTSTAAELNILDGVTATTAELNILDGVTATAAELNYLDGADSDINTLVLPASTTISTFGASLVDDANAAAGLVTLGLSATAAEINYLDNDDLTAADITKLAALTATAAEINYLDNDDLTAADITKLAAIDATAAELNYLDLTNAIGTAAASEAVVLDASKNITGINQLTASYFAGNGAGITNIDVSNLDATGADTNVQFNQNGEFGANANFTYDGSGSVATSVMLSSADLKATNLFDNRLPLVGASGLLQDNAVFGYIDSRAQFQGYLALHASSSASGSAYLGDGVLSVFGRGGFMDSIFTVDTDGMEVEVEANFESDVTAYSSIYVEGGGEISGSGDLAINGEAQFAGNVSANSDEEANNFAGTSGALRTLGGLSVVKKVQVGGDVRSESGIYAGDEGFGVFAARLASDGSISGSASLQLGGSATIQGNVIAYGNLNTTAGNISGSGALMIGGQSTFAGTLLPLTDEQHDLGSSTKEWKDLYVDGVAYIDDLRADVLGADLNCSAYAMTNINVDSGVIDGTIIGASVAAAGTFAAVVATTMSGSSTLKIGGAANFHTTLAAEGAISSDAGLKAIGSSYGLWANDLTRSIGDLNIKLHDASANQVNFRLSDGSMPLSVLSTGVVQMDSTNILIGTTGGEISGSGLLKMGGAVQLDGADDSVDFVVADSMYFFDAGTLQMRRDSWSDVMFAAAGTGITATDGVLSVSAISTPTAFPDADTTMVEGLNYASATAAAARVLTLPDSDDLEVGEFVKIKMAAGVSATNYASIVIKPDSDDLIDGDGSIRLESPYAAVNLYKVATNVWRIL